MPSIVTCNLESVRGLQKRVPTRDNTENWLPADCYAEVRLGSDKEETESLASSRQVRFETVQDDLIQEKPLEVLVKDYQSEELIGIVQVDLYPLLKQVSANSYTGQYSGYFPIYSIENGVQGELQMRVKVEVLRDLDAEPSAGSINYFAGSAPSVYEVRHVVGFVEELIEVKRVSADRDLETQ